MYWITSNTYSFFQAVGAFGATISPLWEAKRIALFPFANFHLDLWIRTQSSSGSRFAVRWESLTPRTSHRRGLACLTARKCRLAHSTSTSLGRGSDNSLRECCSNQSTTHTPANLSACRKACILSHSIGCAVKSNMLLPSILHVRIWPTASGATPGSWAS